MAPVILKDFLRRKIIEPGPSTSFVMPTQGRILFTVVVINAIIIFVYRVSTLIVASSDSTASLTTDHVWFFFLTIESSLFMVYFSWDAVTSENVYTLLAFLACALVLGARSLLEFLSFDVSTETDLCSSSTAFGKVCLASTVTQGTFTLLYFILTLLVYRSFGWRFYRQFGSDAMLHRMYIGYQQFLSLKFLDLSFSLLMITTGIIYLAFTTYGSVISAVALLAELFWMRLGTVAIIKENDIAMKWWVRLSFLSPIYIVFFWVAATSEGMAVNFNDVVVVTANTSSSSSSGQTSSISSDGGLTDNLILVKMIVLSVLAVGNRIVSVIFGMKAWRNFNKGLLTRVFYAGGGNQTRTAHAAASGQPADSSGIDIEGSGLTPKRSEPQHGRGASIFDDVGTVNVVNSR